MLRQAHVVEPLNHQCMDTLALRLYNMQAIEASRELDTLCAELIGQRSDSAEKYTACTYMALGETKTTNRALYLAQKAVLTAQSTLCERKACANAYLAKARVLIALNNHVILCSTKINYNFKFLRLTPFRIFTKRRM